MLSSGARHRKTVRATLLEHLGSGKPLTAEGYRLLLATYENVKPDKQLAPVLDDLVGIIEGPRGRALLKQSSGLGVLSRLARQLVQVQRWESAMRMHELYFAYQKSLPIDLTRSLFLVANRIGPEALARALVIHERVLKRRPAMDDITPIKIAATRARKTLAAAGLKAPGPPSVGNKLGALIAAIQASGGARGKDGQRFAKPKPLPAAALKKLTLPGGKALSPSIAQWLAFDASWLPLFSKGTAWNSVTLAEFLGAYAVSLGRSAALGVDYAKAHVDGTQPKTPVVVLPPLGKQDQLLVIDRVGKDGEVPVYARRGETIFLKHRSFGEYLVGYLRSST